jgi:hypothetical protein
MKTLQESIIGRKAYQKMEISDLKPGDVLKVEGDFHPYEYFLLISGDDYYKLFKDRSADDFRLVIVTDSSGGWFTPLWDEHFKNTDEDFLENGDIIEIFPDALDERKRRAKKFYSSAELERMCMNLPSIKVN